MPSFSASSSNTSTNSRPMVLRLSSGSVTPRSPARKRAPASTAIERNVVVAAEEIDHLARLVLAQQTVIDEDAGELIADRLVDEERRDGRIDAA